MDLGDKIELRGLSAILSDARGAAPDIDFLVVGAMARDLLLHYGHGVPITYCLCLFHPERLESNH